MTAKNRMGSSWWRGKFRGYGYKITTGREIVLEVMAKAKKHLSAEDIYINSHAVNSKIGMTTIYRTLDILTEMGVVNKFDFGDGRARYELTEGPKGMRHHHLVCTECNRAIDYTDFIDEEVELLAKTEKVLAEKYNFKILRHHIQFYGLCENCQNEK